MAVNKLDITMMEDVGTSASQLLQRDGSGNIPAVDGSQVTGITEFTTSTSDPAIDTNPAGGVGSLWYNKTGGEMFVCTDATAGANVWINVGAGSGNIQTLYQGTQKGYSSGDGAAPNGNVIDWFSFTSDGNSTDHADLSAQRTSSVGHSSSSYGYVSGGAPTNYIEKFPFASATNGTNIGNLSGGNVGRNGPGGTSDTIYGYSAGGSPSVNIIDRFPYASDTNASDVGDLLSGLKKLAGASSTSHGYTAGGASGPVNVIQKFAFTASANATDVGDLTSAFDSATGHQSDTHGYKASGYQTASPQYISASHSIQKWSFASDADATNVGTTTVGKAWAASHSSTTYGYASGGTPTTLDVIEKFTFASDAAATDVGNLTVGRSYFCGQQY